MTRSLCGWLPDELTAWCATQGEPAYRARQILTWVHQRSQLDPGHMTNLPQPLRAALAEAFPDVGAEVTHQATAADETRKLRLAFRRGGAVETVLIPDGAKLTQCLSTQVGCAFKCKFCLSGSRGLERNLEADEILAQVHLALGLRAAHERLSNIVLMGSGEPLANYKETRRVLQLLVSPLGLAMSTRRVTVSTVGLPEGIRRLGEDFGGNIGLAVSLHGPDDVTRGELIPTLSHLSVAEIIRALRAYPLPPRRRITIEYVLVRGLNDHPRQAAALVRTLHGLRVKVNLIPFNEHPEADFSPPDAATVETFQQTLLASGVHTILRRQRGAEIGAACGQLAAAPELTDAR